MSSRVDTGPGEDPRKAGRRENKTWCSYTGTIDMRVRRPSLCIISVFHDSPVTLGKVRSRRRSKRDRAEEGVYSVSTGNRNPVIRRILGSSDTTLVYECLLSHTGRVPGRNSTVSTQGRRLSFPLVSTPTISPLKS